MDWDAARARDVARSRILLVLAVLSILVVVVLPRDVAWVSWVLFVAFTIAATRLATRGIPASKKALFIFSEWRLMAFIAGGAGFVLLTVLGWLIR
jgi:hypothetical protein